MSELGPAGQSVGASGARSAELGSGRPEAVLINPWMIASCAGVNWAVGSRGGEWRCRRRSPLSGTRGGSGVGLKKKRKTESGGESE